MNDKLKTIDEMLEVQKKAVNGDVYMQGLYNGMEFTRSIITNTEPIYIDSDGTLDEEAVKRNPERYI